MVIASSWKSMQKKLDRGEEDADHSTGCGCGQARLWAVTKNGQEQKETGVSLRSPRFFSAVSAVKRFLLFRLSGNEPGERAGRSKAFNRRDRKEKLRGSRRNPNFAPAGPRHRH